MLYGDFPSRWSDVSCVDSYSFCVPCEFSRRSTLYLRGPGVCKTSPFNRQYILQGESGGKPALSGYFHSEIVYDSKASSWIMKSLKVAGAIARWTPIRSGEYPFGKRPWTLGYDVCGLRNGDVVNMTLSVCGDGQFTCADGTCIDLSLRCDMREDCPDFSDEMKCSLVEIPTGYQKSIPPPSPRSNRPLPVKFSINIMSFSSIVTQDQTYGISFEVRLNWRDRRLNFMNLKEDRILNLLSPETINAIWTPKVFFKNAHDQIVAHAREDSMIECIREGSPIIGAPELPEED
ncbi:uncharacterized protein [Palaemon carinicauda]|uniref:uncharacterized protein n=1 Tax=Palaemon carinicauda TaxID=392227 RepID=UPI0035B588E7